MNFLLAAAVHRLCLAHDLTLHVTCRDITHSCERKTEYGLRAHCLPSKSHSMEADTRSYGFTNKALRPFQNLLSIYFTISSHWSGPILRHCCKNSKALRKHYLWFLCRTKHSYAWKILFTYAFIFPHLFLLRSIQFLKDWTVFIYPVWNSYISASKKNAMNKKQVKF